MVSKLQVFVHPPIVHFAVNQVVRVKRKISEIYNNVFLQNQYVLMITEIMRNMTYHHTFEIDD